MVGIPSLPAYVTKILSVTYYAHFGLSCPEWQFNGTVFRDARLDRFSCRFGSRSEFTDNVKRLTSRHPDCRQPLPNLVTSELPVIRQRSANTGRHSAINLAVHIHAAASRGVSLS